ncbi:hypothetical protein PybrP1_010845 [[Pythium] brassicae (nom. inval.)]|nr:hypothetical protein PybrP1_010845 [[Pythium] brassicae (nom. inval.)]
MLRESMGGDGVRGSDAKSFQQLKAGDGAGAPTNSLAYAPMHYGADGVVDAAQTQHFGGQLIPGANMGPVTCLVCYNAQVDVLLEPCGHQFHLHCIDRWLNKDKVCPICWNPIQSQRRLLVQAHYNNSQQQQQQQHQQHQAGAPTPSGSAAAAARAAYAQPSPAHAGNSAGTHMGAAPAAASASADGSVGAPTEPATAANPAATRKGKWTAEESLYCDRLIEEFKKGNLPLAEGTTLRTFLAKLLNCDPMRISKKYTGDQCIGKIIFRRREDEVSKEDMELIRRDLAELEKTYLEREQTNQRRREKRLESELSRDKGRYVASRALGGYSAAPPAAAAAAAAAGAARAQTPVAVAPAGQYQQQQQQQQPPPPPSHQQNAVSASMPAKDMHAAPNPMGAANGSHGDSGVGRPSGDNSFLSSSHGAASNALSGSQQQHHEQQQQHHEQQHQHQQQPSNESFPRVSSIDSFSCLFPRVASIDNFQLPHQGGSSSSAAHQTGGYGNASHFSESSSYDPSSGTMIKSMSIGDGLNAYFPRVQSLEQLSTLLEEHAPPSPRTKSESGNRLSKFAKEEPSSSLLSGGTDRKRMGDLSSVVQMKEEQQRDVESDLHRRLSPTGANKPTEHSNQIQIPKPLSKMPRSSSGIFPRIPSMDKLPHVPSLDKIPRVPSLDKLPRIPSMDKLASSSERIPRVPSMDKLAHMSRIPSHSDMLSRFGSSDHLSSFPSFSNLSSLSTCASYTNLSGLNGGGGGGGGGGGFKSSFPRNSSIEDILSLVASSESNSGGMSSAGSHLQLSALAAVAGEESSQMAAAADRKRRLEHAQELESKKNKLSA